MDMSLFVVITMIMVEATLLLIGLLIYLILRVARSDANSNFDDNDRIQYNMNVFQLINNTVHLEVIEIIKLSEMVGEKYTSKNLDKDIKLVAERVYEAFKKEIYMNSNNIYTPEYMLQYITRQASLQLFEYLNGVK